NLAYIADFREGLRIIDVSAPGSPHEISFFDTGSFASSVAVSSDLAYVTDNWGGLRIINVSDPT
ncbi:MAG: hypothetical protein GWN00_38060, partial [Aliifodinibius sp.]|nr:hypothetical protein [candidate division Zixibacteria bacterium]NIT61803.1 hypothetical protein [Fodinibius sp.]NIS49156.1 hypothetical protein [candidate division Zixibacteria bacterium]NIU17251.1 hypothetical protein [candidate division Zixibacteria bacterium]NIV09374.1 hypothetical protein [candidate division Zixibacteria bacterium]